MELKFQSNPQSNQENFTFEQCGQMLDEIADSMPVELYRELNAGISLVPQAKIHPAAVNNDLYILGEYVRDYIGKSIVFYYGSINRIYGNLPHDQIFKELERLFHHELRHHNEFLAGCDDLGDYDREQIEAYLKSKENNN
ncbi:MAG: metallopeptidase family protein [Ruminococcus sp.]|nr:metallopeptidase family protein [Ruminococcus sp.]